jgi:hypothetical protein
MAIGLGPGKGKKKEASKPLKAYSKGGQMVAAPGYAMGITPKKDGKTHKMLQSKYGTMVVPSGIIAPKPLGPGGKAGAAAPDKKKGPSAVGKAISKAKTSIEMASRRRFATSAYRGGGGGGRRGGGKTCAAYR